jgi:hypothetical protein
MVASWLISKLEIHKATRDGIRIIQVARAYFTDEFCYPVGPEKQTGTPLISHFHRQFTHRIRAHSWIADSFNVNT